MPPTTTYEFGDVLLVPFPFTDQTGAKRRPAVVVSSRSFNQKRPDLILMPVSSQQRPKPAFGEVFLSSWKPRGLLSPSVTKPIVFTLEKSLVTRKLARLNATDCAAVTVTLRAMLG